MTKHCGLSRFLTFLVAALVCATLAAPESQAQGGLMIGPGVQDPCYNGTDTYPPGTPDGMCGILGGSVNVILGDTLNVYQNSVQGADRVVSPLLLMFAVPVENLLYPFFGGNQFNGPVTAAALDSPATHVDAGDLPCGPDCSAELAAGSPVPVGFPTSPVVIDYSAIFSVLPNSFPTGFPGGFDQGELFALGATGASGVVVGNTSVYDFIGLPGAPNSNHINNWASASVEIPSIVLGIPEDQFITPSGWRLWVFTLDVADLMGAQDAIQAIYDEDILPLGTWAFAWGIGEKCAGQDDTPDCDKVYYGMSMTESALLMPLPEGEVPEPTSLLLLGTGLLAVGRKWRKKQQARKQNVV